MVVFPWWRGCLHCRTNWIIKYCLPSQAHARTHVFPKFHSPSPCLLHLLTIYLVRSLPLPEGREGTLPRNKRSDSPTLCFSDVKVLTWYPNLVCLHIHVCSVSLASVGCFSRSCMGHRQTLIIRLARVVLRHKPGKSNHPKGIHYVSTAFSFDVEYNLSNWS